MADIFVSYARDDRTRVRRLAEALSAHGWSVWWDRQIQAGKTFDQVIADALASSRCVIVMWSHQSITSDWVREEAEEGRRRGILIPVLIDDVRPPLGFGRIQAVQLSDWTGADGSDEFQKLVADIAAILGPPQPQGAVTEASPSIERQAGALVSEAHGPAARMDEAPSPLVGEHRGEVATGPAVVSSPRGDGTTAPSAQAPDGPRTPAFFDLSKKRVRWSLATGFAIAILTFGLVWLGIGDDGTSQPNPAAAPAAESALRLDAVMIAGGKPLESGVRYDVYEAAKDAEGKRKPVTYSSEAYGPPRFPLPAGRYYVTATYGSAAAGTEVDVTAGDQPLRQTLDLKAGILSLASVLASGGKPLETGVRYDVYEAAKDAEGKRKPVTYSSEAYGPPRFPLPAGRYYVTASSDAGKSGSEVTVSSGEVRQLQLRLSRQNGRN
jgi:hypothetical protein